MSRKGIDERFAELYNNTEKFKATKGREDKVKKSVLIVDDNEMNREIIAEMLRDTYYVNEASNGKEAIEFMDVYYKDVTVVLLDLVMPRMDGYEVLKVFSEKKWFDKIPVLVISGEQSYPIEQKCFDLGASDFIRKPFNAAIVRKRVDNAAELTSYKNQLEEKVKRQTNKIIRYAQKMNRMNNDIIDILGSVVESRDMESGEHILRVKGYTKILATELMKRYKEYKLTPEKIQLIASASALHDIGKIAIPDTILLKPGRLTDDEFVIMKEHSLKGYELIQKVKSVWDKDYVKVSSEIARYHHERYDGKGYPEGLKGDDIPISAQIVSLADVYDALVNERCYKKAFSKDEAFDMILSGKCGVFSPKLLDCFMRTRAKFEKMADKQIRA